MRRTSIALLLVGWVVPALAQDDPFRTAAPPPPVVAKPAPHPPPPEEPPPVVAPQPPPPPSQFSADYVGRVKQAAVAQKVQLPDAVVIREEATPAGFRNYLGAWGPGSWRGGTRFI
ncbi:MAG TPA: hypothetical protein VK432_09405 [Stellaceae bacterium]|nr:hypothetical protein [Stellaceae bacterium]